MYGGGGGGGGAAAFVGVKVRKTTALSVTTAASAGPLEVPFATANATEEFDTDGFHNPAANTGRLVVPAGQAGTYLIIASAAWAANATGFRRIDVNKNDATGIVSDSMAAPAIANNAYDEQTCSAIVALAVGDYINMAVRQSSGGNLNLLSDAEAGAGAGSSLTLVKVS